MTNMGASVSMRPFLITAAGQFEKQIQRPVAPYFLASALLPMAALSAEPSFAGWISTFLGEWPVWGNCPSAFAPAAKVDSPRNLVSQLRKSNDRFGLKAVIRCTAAPKG